MRREGPPRVLALWLPDLPVQRLRRGRGADGGPPLAVAADGRIVSCDAAARRGGVRAGMSASEAVAACGALEVAMADPAADLAALRGLGEALLAIAPAVEIGMPDVLLLDAGAAHLAGVGRGGRGAGQDPGDAEAALSHRGRALAAELGWTTRAAVAGGRGPARALARHGPSEAVRVAPGDEARALAPLPLAALALPDGVAGRLEALGIRDAGALARLPPETLAHRFGEAGVAAWRLARGQDETPLVPFAAETLPVEAIELEAPAESAEPLLFALKRIADRVAARLAGRGLGATRLKLVLKLDPRGEERVLIPLAHPTASAARWLVPAKEHVFALRLPGAVTALELAAIEVAPVEPEQLAIGDRPEALAALETVLSRLAIRLGDAALFSAEPVERYRPEAAYRPVAFRPGSPARSIADGSASPLPREVGERGNGVPAAMRGEGARPRGSRRPGTARTAGAVTEATADPAPFRPTRLLAAPRLAVAEGEGGRITAIRLGARAWQVLALEGPERISGEWWASPFDRAYWRVRLDGLGDCWIYRDGADGRLWLHGFFD